MRQNLINCSLVAGKTNIKVYRYLKNNPRVDQLGDFVEDITNILFKVTTDLETAVGDFRDWSPETNLGQYLDNVSANIATLSTIVYNNNPKGESNLNDISGKGKYEIADLIGESIATRIELRDKTLTESLPKKQEAAPVEDTITSTDADSGISSESTVADMLSELGEARETLSDGMLKLDAIHDLYFKELPEYFESFKEYFINNFSDALVGTSYTRNGKVKPMGLGDDIGATLDKMQVDLEAKADQIYAGNITVKELVEQSNGAREIFFANVATVEFPSLVRSYLPGVKIEDKGYTLKKDSVREGYGYDGSFSGFDQSTKALQLHLYTTPRLETTSKDGVFKTADKNSYLSTFEIKNVADTLNSYPSDLEGFRNALRKDVIGKDGPNVPVLRSLYYKFFGEESYEVDGVKKDSYTTIIEDRQDERLNEVLSALITDMRSNQTMEHVIIDNGKVIITKAADVEMESILKENLDMGLSHFRDPKNLKSDIDRLINVELDEDASNGFRINIGGGQSIQFKKGLDRGSGIPVLVTEETSKAIGDVSTAATILKKLGMPPYVNQEFLEYYKDNIKNYGTTSGQDALSIANLVGNYVYSIAINNEENRKHLENKGFLIEAPTVVTDGLTYPILETMYEFKAPLADMLNVTEGTTVKKMRKNINGDLVATTAPKARIYELPNIIGRIRKDGDTFFNNNVLVNGLDNDGVNEFELIGFRSKDGMTKGLVSKGNSELSEKEQLQYLIEHSYLGTASASNYKETLIQPGVMSDRSLVDLGYFKASDAQSFLPDGGVGKLQEDQLRDDFIKSQRNQHQQIANQVVTEWKGFLTSLIDNNSYRITEKTVDKVKDLKTLSEVVKKAKINYNDVRKSGLIAELMYKEVKVDDKVSHAVIKDILVEMDTIWNDKTKSEEFTKATLNKFKADLTRIGYTADKLGAKAVTSLEERFGTASNEASFEILTTSYFYQSNLLSNSAMDLMMGSRYQFKGDMNVDAIKKSKAFKEATKGFKKSPAKIEKIARQIARERALGEMFGNQAKRNASLGSGHQLPRLAGENEKGKYLGKYSNTAVIDDPSEMVKLLGDLNEKTKQEVYDAAMFAHPLYFLRLNESLGHSMSGYTTKGGPVKDISNEIDYKTGVFRFQKKATFNMFDYELLAKGTPELHNLLQKMNKAIKFTGGPIVFEGETIQAKNMQELWEHFGAYTNPGKGTYGELDYEPSSWEQVLNVLGENPHIRDSYIEKVGFVSGEKSGNRKVNTKGVFEGNEVLKHTPFSNEHHGVILNPDHNPDSTASYNVDKDVEDNLVSLMTQVISAVAFEGNSRLEVDQINDALLSLSETGLEKIQHTIYSTALQTLENWTDSPEGTPFAGNEDWFELAPVLKKFNHTPEEESMIESFIQRYDVMDIARKEYGRKLTADAIANREDYGSSTEMINMKDAPLDSKMLHNALHTSIMSEFNKATTRVKFKGGQFIVASSFAFVKNYTTENGRSLQRDEYMHAEEIPLETIGSTSGMIPTDPVWVDDSEEPMTLWEAEKLPNWKTEFLDKNKVQSRRLTTPETLKWMRYEDADGNSLTDQPLYKSLMKEKNSKKRAELELDLQELLNNGSWTALDSEFYMPQVHQEAYNLDSGDTIHKIMGNYDVNSKDPMVRQNALELQEIHMIDFFKKKIDKNESKYDLGKRDIKKLTVEGLGKMLAEARADLASKIPSTLDAQYKANKVALLHKLSLYYTEHGPEELISRPSLKKINDQKDDHEEFIIEGIAKKQAKSFPKTLEIIASRIPGQGKQSYTAGKIKGFITSQRNSVYGPLEMLTITGADHDIDKSSIIVYSVDINGELYSADNYLDEETGKLSKEKFTSYFNNKRNNYIKYLNSINSSNIKERLDKFDKAEYDYLSEATKNYILDKLLISARNPQNAIEAATPVSIDRVKDQVDEVVDYMISDEGDVEMISENTYSQYNPTSIPLLEIVNTTGKAGVGIFATGLKGYAAMFTAWTNGIANGSKYINFKNEATAMFSGNRASVELYEKLYGKQEKGLKLYNSEATLEERYKKLKDAGVKGLPKLDKFIEENRKRTSRTLANTEKYYQDMIRDAREIRELELEPQAWEDLSVLLSAATDNAKELILARIGATNNTSGLIATGVMMGFDLVDMLDLLKDPKVKTILQSVDDSTDFTSKPQERLTLESALENYMSNEYGSNNKQVSEDLTLKDKEIRTQEKVLAETIRHEKTPTEIKKFMNLTDVKKANVVSLVGLNKNTGKFGSKTSTIENRVPTPTEMTMLKEHVADLDGVNFDKVNKSELLAVHNMLSEVSHVVIDNNFSDLMSLTQKMADQMGVPVYKIASREAKSYQGEWLKVKNGLETRVHAPIVMTSQFAFLSDKNLNSDEETHIQNAVEATKDVIRNPREYNKKIKENIALVEDHIQDLNNKRDNIMHDFLTDGPRQLQMFQKISTEMRSFTGILAINQGIPNSSWDVYNYLNKFVNQINKITEIDTFMDFNKFERFLKSVEGDGKYADEITAEFDKHKTGVNPFFLLQENKHYFGYIKGLYAARKILQSTTLTTKSVEDIAGQIGDVKKQEQFGSIEGYVYGLGINDFFENSDYKTIKVEGVEYDLRNNIERQKFMLDLVELSKELSKDPKLKNNNFIKGLQTELLKDHRIKDTFPILKTRNLLQADEHNRVMIRQGLEQLRTMNGKYTEFHNALYFYSLILNKGGVGAKSFASLFGTETQANLDYLAHLNKLQKSEKLVKIAMKYGKEGAQLANPLTIKEVDTISTGQSMEEAPSEADIPEGFARPTTFSGLSDAEYVMPYSNKKHGDLIRSRQTGKIYMWNKIEGAYIVVTPMAFVHKGQTQRLSHRVIPTTDATDVWTANGYDFGETAVIDQHGSTGQVYSYNGKDGYRVRTQNRAFIEISGEVLSDLNRDMLFHQRNFGKLSIKQQEEVRQKGLDIKGKKQYKVQFPYKASSLLGGGGIQNRILNKETDLFKTPQDLEVSKNDTRIMEFGEGNWYEVTNLGNAYNYVQNFNIKEDDLYAFLGYKDKNLATTKEVKKLLNPESKENLYQVKPYDQEVDLSMLGTGKSVEAGTYSKALTESDLVVSKEHMQLAAKATIAHGLGKADWVKDISTTIKEELTKVIKPTDKVWFFGDTISDNKDYKATVNNYKKLINTAADATADILIGKGNGVEEELKSYIMDNYPAYTPTDDGFVYNKKRTRTPSMKKLVKDIDSNRFNSNNTFSREGMLTGPYGTVLYTTANKVPSEGAVVEYDLFSEKVVSWADQTNVNDVIESAMALTKKAGETKWDDVRDQAMETEEFFIRDLIAAGFLTKLDPDRKIETYTDLQIAVQDELSNDPEYNEYMDELFEDGESTLSNTLKLAMSRNRYVTFNYFQERFPELFVNMKNPVFSMINESKANEMATKEWQDMMKSTTVSKADLKLIQEDGKVMFREMYHYLSTVGDNAYTDKGRVYNEKLNNHLSAKGIKAVKAGSKVTVLDNDALLRFEAKAGKNNIKSGDKAMMAPVTFINEAKRKYASQRVSKPVMRKVFNAIYGKFDVSAELMSKIDIEAKYGKAYSELSGWTTEDGEVIVNLDKATLDTPLHEFGGHIFMKNIKITNPELHERIINLALESDLAETIAKRYKHLDTDGVAEEVFSTLFGLHNQGKLLNTESNNDIWNRITNLAKSNPIVDFIRKQISSIFGLEESVDFDMNDSLIDIIDKLGNDIVYGDGSVMNNLNEKAQQMVQDMRAPIETEEMILERLENLNMIKKICI